MRKESRENQGGMPDADYVKTVARHEYAWFHRMEPDPLEGFAHNQNAGQDAEKKSATEPDRT